MLRYVAPCFAIFAFSDNATNYTESRLKILFGLSITCFVSVVVVARSDYSTIARYSRLNAFVVIIGFA